MNGLDPGLNEQNKWEGGPRRNISSDMINTVQICIPAIKVTFQETPVSSSYKDVHHKRIRMMGTQKYLRH